MTGGSEGGYIINAKGEKFYEDTVRDKNNP
jgi:hypothetical protein